MKIHSSDKFIKETCEFCGNLRNFSLKSEQVWILIIKQKQSRMNGSTNLILKGDERERACVQDERERKSTRRTTINHGNADVKRKSCLEMGLGGLFICRKIDRSVS